MHYFDIILSITYIRSFTLSARNVALSSSRQPFSWFLLISANVLWAATYVAAKFALRDTSVNVMLAIRMSIASLILLPLLLAGRKELHLTRRDIPQLVMLMLTGFVINKLLEYVGLALTTASDVALLITSESIFTAALSWMLLRERFRKLTGLALCLGFVGVYLIVERSLIPNIPTGGGIWRIVGDLLVVLALLVEAFYTVRGKALLVKHPPLLITSASIVGSLLFWLPVAGWEIFTTGWHPIGPVAWIGIGWMALMSTVLAYLAWFQGLAKVNGSAAASTLFIQPLLGTLLAIVLLGEQLTLTTVIGGVLIIVSVYLISRQE
jgi:drug/metabolite transporter (DMT)-like permease